MYEQIQFEITDKNIAIITLNRPEAYNAISDVMRNELREVIDTINLNSKIRAVIITGAGKGFCAGGDVKVMVDRLEEGMSFETRREIFEKDVATMVKKIRSIKVPTIAAVNGGAFGAGASISLLCDIRIADEKAKFGFLFGKRALIPDWGCNYFLPRTVGYSRALELTATGRIITAKEAYEYGLVNQIAPAGEVVNTALEMCRQIITSSPGAVIETKKALAYGLVQELNEALDYEGFIQSSRQTSGEHVEGVRSFQEKREPNY